jgi:hypothetical protein
MKLQFYFFKFQSNVSDLGGDVFPCDVFGLWSHGNLEVPCLEPEAIRSTWSSVRGCISESGPVKEAANAERSVHALGSQLGLLVLLSY